MIEWGGRGFGGNPHVIEPTETITKDGEKKFPIIYSMGISFLTNASKPWKTSGLNAV